MSDWTELKNEKTLRLTEIFQDSSCTQSLRENAFHALCFRFKEGVLSKLEISCKRFGNNVTVAEEVATATFTAYAKKGNFKPEEVIQENIDDAFRNYLLAIAKNELTNYYRAQQRKRNYPYDGSEQIVAELPALEGINLNLEQTILIKAIQSLTPAQRTIYLTYKKYEKLGYNLPKKLREELRAHLGGIEQTTIRGYKKEALDKIRSYTEVMNLTKELTDGKI